DDFEDGNAFDWTFFGGNAAGGGGGALSDRPQEGSFYLSTGWGGGGSGSVFYGGLFKNVPEADQLETPEAPWFNVWVLNQSDATVDAYTLEITVREDLDGDGWTNGQEDSFRLDVPFTSADFDDNWRLVSAPLDSFVDLATGGDGTFDGRLDEVVVVVAGVQGADGSVVEVDFDYFALTAGGPLVPPSEVLYDDMEHGDPFGNDWFTFGGAVGGGGIDANFVDLPPTDGGAASLQTGWGSGGTPGFFGGFGRQKTADLFETTHFNLWINPDPVDGTGLAQEYLLEINLQDDDDGDGAIPFPPDGGDDEFQYDCVVSATGPCAIAGGGWQLLSIPLADFFDDNSFHFGGNGTLDAVGTARGGNGAIENVVVAVIGQNGSDVNFRTDRWAFTEGPRVGCTVDPFEDGDFAGWTLDGLGHANQMVAQVIDDGGNGELALTSDGATAYLGADNAGFLHRDVTGDFRFEATIDSKQMTTGKEWRKAGLMVRTGLDAFDVRLLTMLAPVQERLQFVAREVANGPGNVKVATEVAGAPATVRFAIERVGQTLTVQYSDDDGVTWITPTTGLGGSIDIPALPETLLVGLSTVSNNISVTTTALFDDVSICPLP
ncbi:MAG: hypothetical protein AAGE94_15830, partial [Acidobacteriota bacterium]